MQRTFRYYSSAHPTGLATNRQLIKPSDPNQSILPNQLLAALVHELELDSSDNDRIPNLPNHFRQLPVFVGHCQTLDSIIECHLLSRRMVRRGAPTTREEINLYSESVIQIRQALATDLAPTILMATLLLYQYEAIRPDDCRSVLVLSKGVSAILQNWGPQCLGSPIIQIIARAHFVAAVTHSLFTGESCFAVSQEWQKALRCLAIPSFDLWLAFAKICPAIGQLRNDLDQTVFIPKLLDFQFDLDMYPFVGEEKHHDVDYHASFIDDNKANLEVWLFYACRILSNELLRYHGDGLFFDILETKTAIRVIVNLLSAAKTRIPLIATLAAPLAYGAGTEQDRQHIRRAMQRLPTLAHKFGHVEMMYYFELFIGIRNE